MDVVFYKTGFAVGPIPGEQLPVEQQEVDEGNPPVWVLKVLVGLNLEKVGQVLVSLPVILMRSFTFHPYRELYWVTCQGVPLLIRRRRDNVLSFLLISVATALVEPDFIPSTVSTIHLARLSRDRRSRIVTAFIPV